MEDFVTSDIHLGHYSIPLHCGRLPWLYDNPDFNPDKPEHIEFNNPKLVNLKDHDECLIENWNSMVGRKDRIIIIGDLAFRDHERYIRALNGRKIMICGNHDDMNLNAKSLFKEIHEFGCVKKLPNFTNIKDSKGKFHKHVCVTFCHYALASWDKSCYGFPNLHIHAHSHGRMPEFANMFRIDGGVDVWGYAPAPWRVMLKKFEIIYHRIKEMGLSSVDGENKASGVYNVDPNQRVLDVRKQNMEITRSMGLKIIPEYWPNVETSV